MLLNRATVWSFMTLADTLRSVIHSPLWSQWIVGSVLGSGTSCELFVGALPCHEGFSPGSPVFLPPVKINTSKVLDRVNLLYNVQCISFRIIYNANKLLVVVLYS
jgi:hypothetical protein